MTTHAVDLSELEAAEFDFILDALSDPEILPTNSVTSPYSPAQSTNGHSSTPTNMTNTFESNEVVRWANEGVVICVDSAHGVDHDTGPFSLLSSRATRDRFLIDRAQVFPSFRSPSSPASSSPAQRSVHQSTSSRKRRN